MVNQVEFWQQRWVDNLTGFHEGEVNSYLEKHYGLLSLTAGAEIFLPLCGKSHDMIWLSEHGFNVVGVECSEIAVTAFFSENNLTATIRSEQNFTIYQTSNITIYCGDFYQLNAAWFKSVTAIFDRAALVALEQRELYINQLHNLCPTATILLVSFEYSQQEMTGPPFAVSEDEIEALYRFSYQLTRIENNDILEENVKFKERGITALAEKVFLMKPK